MVRMRRVKRLVSVAAMGPILLVVACSRPTPTPQGSRWTLGVNQLAPHPLLDAVAAGLLEGLREGGISEETGSRIILKNANGDQNLVYQINRQFADQHVDMIIPIATAAAQSACQVTTSIPIVFAAITDPVKAGIAVSLDHPGGNKTGTSDRWPYRAQVGLIRQLVPSAKKVGMLFNQGESNTVASLEQIRPALREYGFTEVSAPVTSTGDIYLAAKSLVGRCDVLLIPSDNTVVSAFTLVVKIANEHRIPLFAGNTECVEEGAIATFGVNYREIGHATGLMAAKILRERTNPGDLPVQVEAKTDFVVNLAAAKAQGVTIPARLLQGARVVGGATPTGVGK